MDTYLHVLFGNESSLKYNGRDNPEIIEEAFKSIRGDMTFQGKPIALVDVSIHKGKKHIYFYMS